MYCYKLNNSYTVYVNYAYLNDCINASKEINLERRNQNSKVTFSQKNSASVVTLFKPIPNQSKVRHKNYGQGKVISTSSNGTMRVLFGEKEIRLQFPMVVKKGLLQVIV
jgi:hypothetical protein